MNATPVIAVRDLRKWFPTRTGQLKAVDGVSFAIGRGELLGVAGESGCGKSTMAMTVLQLLRPNSGQILFEGADVAADQSARGLRAFRRHAQMVFQSPYESLNPRFTIEQSVREPIGIHFPESRAAQTARAMQAMERVGLHPVAAIRGRYPHQLSGGQLQRAAIARAISIEPSLLVADEPVSMLDVSIRAGILNLLRRFAGDLRMAILYISHDLSTMRHVATHVAIMYLGRIVEIGPAREVLDTPLHPYAQALMAAIPRIGGRRRARVTLEGAVPDPARIPAGCRFHPRCPQVMAKCREIDPAMTTVGTERATACHLYDEPNV